MPLEQADYIAQLNTSNPLSTDTVSQADDHLRLIKSVLKNTFPNLSAPVTATADQINTPIPSGFIGMWSGSIASIPQGWFLCDGTNGTPNLIDRFIVGAGSSYAVGATGGAASVTLNETQLPAHGHTVTSSGTLGTAGAHTHTITDPGHFHSVSNIAASGSGYPGWDGSGDGATSGNSGTKTTGITVNSAGDHTHTLSITSTAANTGGGQSHENRPPYFALAYIMKA